MMELLPWAMLAKGPAWTKVGWPSSVCMRLGLMASFMSTIIAPAQPRSSAVTGSPDLLMPMIIRPRRLRMSSVPSASARMAMISEATDMSKPVFRLGPSSHLSLWPTSMNRRAASLTSTTRRQVTASGSMFRRGRPVLAQVASSACSSCLMRASTAAASRLLAMLTAWMSPVRWRLNSSMGITWLYPPPAAPPLMPKVGPIEGWRMHRKTFLPITPMAWVSPTAVVVLPSPSGVGVMAVTSMYLPLAAPARRSRMFSLTLALTSP